MKLYHVYIMASHRRVVYTGVTGRLQERVWEHKHDVHPDAFSAKYRCHKLVYVEHFNYAVNAIHREKVIKHMTRAEKVALIQKENPKWRDLGDDWKKPPQVLPARFARGKDDIIAGVGFRIEKRGGVNIVHLWSEDGTNRLTAAAVTALTKAMRQFWRERLPIVLTGNQHFFSAGADLGEINALTGPAAFAFGRMGQRLMQLVDDFPCPVVAAVSGYCMGGGLDLALACDRRIAASNAIFGHRGAALGLMTGWGGTQRLPRLIGKGRAQQMFLAAEKLHAQEALRIGLVDEVADDPVAAALVWLGGNCG